MGKYINKELIIILALIIIYIGFVISNIPYPGEMCVLDGVRYIASAINISKIIVIFEIYHLYITKDDLQINKIIRMNNRRQLWNKQIRKNTVISLWLSIYALIITVGFAILTCNEGGFINWDEGGSSYVLQSMGNTSNASFYIVIMKALMIIMTQTLVCFYFSQLVIWLTDFRALALILVVAAAISDIHVTYIPLFFSRFNYRIADWGANDFSTVKVIIQLLFIALCIYFCGYIYSGKKEFIGKGS